MKTLRIAVSLSLAMAPALSLRAQIDSAAADSIVQSLVYKADSQGIFMFRDSALLPGELFTLYRQYFTDDTNNTMVIKRQWTDTKFNYDHHIYQLHYRGLPVEGATYSEHIRDGYVKIANGKLAYLDTDTVGCISQADALDYLFQQQGWYESPNLWPWEAEGWDEELQQETGDPDATYFPYPTGKLQWAKVCPGPFDAVIPASCYRLSWSFDVFCVDPWFNRRYFVNAHTGKVFRIDDLSFADGLANVIGHGPQLIDTKSRGWPHNDYILKTDGNGRKIHTKYAGTSPWNITLQITDDDDNWHFGNQNATSVHWGVTKTWDFYTTVFNHQGMDGDQRKVRVRASVPEFEGENLNGASYSKSSAGNYSWISFGFYDNNDYSGVLDVCAHEYTHGVIQFTSNLGFGLGTEARSLAESFCDIFAQRVEYYQTGLLDWTVGEDATPDIMYQRSLQDPKSAYRHYSEEDCSSSSFVLGQPDTYEGEFWEFGECDNWGQHINSGPQNHWFYLLTEGGSGTNDNEDQYFVNGIGLNDATTIAWKTMTTLLKESDYEEARAMSLVWAINLYGYCSQQFFECARAWHAVGVGEEIDCSEFGFGLGTDAETSQLESRIYPNPTADKLVMELSAVVKNARVRVCGLDGREVFTQSFSGNRCELDLGGLSEGVYIVTVNDANFSLNERIVKVNQ